MPKRGDSANYALDWADAVKVLSACECLEDFIVVGVPIFFGLRVSELAHLRADWVHGEELRVPLEQKCSCHECIIERDGVWHPKTMAGTRSLPIVKPIRNNLLNFLRHHPNGLGMTRQWIHKRTKYLMKKAGIRARGPSQDTGYPHALRATCASLLAGAGMSAAYLSYFMGWKSIQVGDHYVKLATAKEGAVKEATRIFGGR